ISLSFASTAIEVGSESSGRLAASFAATGAWLIGPTVTVTAAVAVPPLPSLIVYVKLVVPVKPAVGWNVRPVPPPVITTLPFAGGVTHVHLSVSPSISRAVPHD